MKKKQFSASKFSKKKKVLNLKTLLVGDLHLKSRIILPMVEEKINELDCQRVILLGDYVDANGQNANVLLYNAELDNLLNWKSKMVSKGIEVITLIGNHEAPYLINEPKRYSIYNKKCFIETGEKLYALGLQVAYKLDDYIVSHAGFACGQDLQEWHFNILSPSDRGLIKALDEHVGISRGGKYWVGSPIWADYRFELKENPNPNILKQIVGHTRQSKISLDSSLIGIDTYSILAKKEYPYFEFYGNGDLLLHDNERLSTERNNLLSNYTDLLLHGGNKQLSVVKTNWGTPEIIEKIRANFHVEI